MIKLLAIAALISLGGCSHYRVVAMTVKNEKLLMATDKQTSIMGFSVERRQTLQECVQLGDMMRCRELGVVFE